MTQAFTTIRENFSGLTERELVQVLGWIVDTGMGHPTFEISDDLLDALIPMRDAWNESYRAIDSVIDPEDDGNEAWQDEADYRVDMEKVV